jgi:hypothetical protein
MVTGPVNTARISFHGCVLRTARPPSASCDRRAFALTCSGAGVDLPGFGRVRSDMSDQATAQAARGALCGRARRSVERDDDRGLKFHLLIDNFRWNPSTHHLLIILE